ncbi:hypothetical protein ACFLQI_02245 [Candidatus Undinarchaeota archaeon]
MNTSNRGFVDAPIAILIVLGIVLLSFGVLSILQEKEIEVHKSMPELPIVEIADMIGQSAILISAILVVVGIIFFVIAFYMF